MKTKTEIIKLYLADLNNIVKQSPARDNRIVMLESELLEQESKEQPPEFSLPRKEIKGSKKLKKALAEIEAKLSIYKNR